MNRNYKLTENINQGLQIFMAIFFRKNDVPTYLNWRGI